MGHHIDKEGRFQSDKYPDLPPDKVVLSLKDPRLHEMLLNVALLYNWDDPEFAADLEHRVLQLMQGGK